MSGHITGSRPTSKPRYQTLLLSTIISLFLFAPPLAADWRPLDPAQLALKQSKTDPGAAAEAFFREVHVSNEQNGIGAPKNINSEYVRLKIFTDAGKDFGNVQIPAFRDQNVFGIQGRTIRPDGSIVPLAKDSIFQKVIEKRGLKTKLVTFAMPAVEPGVIIEYKYSKDEGEGVYRYRQLEVQSTFPVDEVTFYIRPLSNSYFGYPAMRLMPFGCSIEHGHPTKEGFDVISVRNVPAYYDEPYSPPLYSSKQWILIYYEENGNSGSDKFWTSLGKDRYHEYADQIKVSREIKELAAKLVAGAATEDERLDKLLQYCRAELKDISSDEITTEQQSKNKESRTTVDTIRRKQGTPSEIDYAFIALALGAGFEARRADISDRATFLFGPGMQSAYFLNTFDVAVKVKDKWKFYDVTNKALPGGILRWQDQGVYALIDDSSQPEMLTTPMLTAQQTTHNRIATFSLSADGTLEGDVREMLFGNLGEAWREENRNTNQAEREEGVRKELSHRFSDFELTNVHVNALPDANKPVGISYHIVVRNYAQRTGKRLFLNPNFFAVGYLSRFSETTRHNSVYFEYPWSEVDNIDISLAAGYEMDHGDVPAGINIPATCTYKVTMGYSKEKNTVQYRRQFFFGDKDLLYFNVKNYPVLKRVFDAMHESDNHMLTFKTEPVTATGN